LEDFHVAQIDSGTLKVNRNLFKKISKLQSLKTLILPSILIENCVDYVEEFKVLAEKVEYAKFELWATIFDKMSDLETKNFQKFKKAIKSHYQIIEEDESSCKIVRDSKKI
jgi:hypothetical protein